jgi:hypothetical protein
MEKNSDLSPSAPSAPSAPPEHATPSAPSAHEIHDAVPVAIAVEAEAYHDPHVVSNTQAPQQNLLPPIETDFEGQDVPDYFTKYVSSQHNRERFLLHSYFILQGPYYLLCLSI